MNTQTFGAGYANPLANMQLRKPYQVIKLHGRVEKTVYKAEKYRKGTKNVTRFVAHRISEAAGYLVKFAFGHSLRLTAAELKRQGFDNEPGLVDMNTGDRWDPELQKQAEQNELLRDVSPNYVPGDDDGQPAKFALGNMAGKGMLAKPKPKRKPAPKKVDASITQEV